MKILTSIACPSCVNMNFKSLEEISGDGSSGIYFIATCNECGIRVRLEKNEFKIVFDKDGK